MDSIHIELEEIETQAGQLESLLLMLEQSLIYNNFGGPEFLPAVAHMTDMITGTVEKIKELRIKCTPEKEEVATDEQRK